MITVLKQYQNVKPVNEHNIRPIWIAEKNLGNDLKMNRKLGPLWGSIGYGKHTSSALLVWKIRFKIRWNSNDPWGELSNLVKKMKHADI